MWISLDAGYQGNYTHEHTRVKLRNKVDVRLKSGIYLYGETVFGFQVLILITFPVADSCS